MADAHDTRSVHDIRFALAEAESVAVASLSMATGEQLAHITAAFRMASEIASMAACACILEMAVNGRLHSNMPGTTMQAIHHAIAESRDRVTRHDADTPPGQDAPAAR